MSIYEIFKLFINCLENNLKEFVESFIGKVVRLNKKKKKVYVCGLDGDFERKKFGTILDIIPWCDDVVKLKARCNHCDKKGIFTMRLMNKTDNKDQILVGETNLYHSTCRRCYEKKYLNI